jgi:hypothetical protein
MFEDPTLRRRAHVQDRQCDAHSRVPAAPESTVSRALLTDPGKKTLEADDVSPNLGPPSGYVIRFTNGLTVRPWSSMATPSA